MLYPGGCPGFYGWCQRVIPTIFDESFSYYELMCKLLYLINDILNLNIDDLKKLIQKNSDDIAQLQIDVKNLQDLYNALKLLVDQHTTDITNINSRIDNIFNEPGSKEDITNIVNNYFETTEGQQIIENLFNQFIQGDNFTNTINNLIENYLQSHSISGNSSELQLERKLRLFSEVTATATNLNNQPAIIYGAPFSYNNLIYVPAFSVKQNDNLGSIYYAFNPAQASSVSNIRIIPQISNHAFISNTPIVIGNTVYLPERLQLVDNSISPTVSNKITSYNLQNNVTTTLPINNLESGENIVGIFNENGSYKYLTFKSPSTLKTYDVTLNNTDMATLTNPILLNNVPQIGSVISCYYASNSLYILTESPHTLIIFKNNTFESLYQIPTTSQNKYIVNYCTGFIEIDNDLILYSLMPEVARQVRHVYSYPSRNNYRSLFHQFFKITPGIIRPIDNTIFTEVYVQPTTNGFNPNSDGSEKNKYNSLTEAAMSACVTQNKQVYIQAYDQYGTVVYGCLSLDCPNVKVIINGVTNRQIGINQLSLVAGELYITLLRIPKTNPATAWLFTNTSGEPSIPRSKLVARSIILENEGISSMTCSHIDITYACGELINTNRIFVQRNATVKNLGRYPLFLPHTSAANVEVQEIANYIDGSGFGIYIPDWYLVDIPNPLNDNFKNPYCYYNYIDISSANYPIQTCTGQRPIKTIQYSQLAIVEGGKIPSIVIDYTLYNYDYTAPTKFISTGGRLSGSTSGTGVTNPVSFYLYINGSSTNTSKSFTRFYYK